MNIKLENMDMQTSWKVWLPDCKIFYFHVLHYKWRGIQQTTRSIFHGTFSGLDFHQTLKLFIIKFLILPLLNRMRFRNSHCFSPLLILLKALQHLLTYSFTPLIMVLTMGDVVEEVMVVMEVPLATTTTFWVMLKKNVPPKLFSSLNQQMWPKPPLLL